MNARVLSLADVEKSLLDKSYQPEINIALPYEAYDVVSALSLSKDVVLGSGTSSEGEFFFFNSNDQSLEWKEHRIDYTQNLASFFSNNMNDISLLKQGVVKIKPDQTRFVKAMVYAPVIDVYFPNGDIDFSIILDGDLQHLILRMVNLIQIPPSGTKTFGSPMILSMR
jgi:hypothetical protein